MKPCKRCNGTGAIMTDKERKVSAGLLKLLRIGAKVRLREMAKALNLSIGHIHDLESGRCAWNKDKQTAYKEAIDKIIELRRTDAFLEEIF